MFIERHITKIIESGRRQVPVIAVIGPRQSGKSTLVKNIFNDYLYLDMQDAELCEFANTDPKGFLKTYKHDKGVILDEAQYAPKLFSQLKVEVDKDPRPGYYVLSGSQNFLLHEKISESLAGRVYFYTLLPFSISELATSKHIVESVDEQLCKGFYPRVYQPQVDMQEYYKNYISTYVERDIRRIKNITDILMFKKFMQLCAARVGSTLNYSKLATDCGISVQTAKSWFALLETSFILFLLPSHHENLRKRITKSPKLYFYDTGLALSLLGFDHEALIKNRELRGAFFENMMILDLIKYFKNDGKSPMLTFFRDSNQNEVDLIIEIGGKTTLLEIKSSETMNSKYFDTLVWFARQRKNPSKLVVAYGGDKVQERSQGVVVPWNKLESVFN